MGTQAPTRAASPLLRLLAFCVDVLVGGIVNKLGSGFGYLLAGALVSLNSRQAGGVVNAETLEHAALNGASFGLFFWSIFGLIVNFGILQGMTGSTIGKALFQLKVVNRKGDVLGFKKSILRTVLYLFSIIPAYLGFLVILFHKKRQGIHDLICDTYVVPATSLMKSNVVALPHLPEKSEIQTHKEHLRAS